mgnify:CR=1 FL=1
MFEVTITLVDESVFTHEFNYVTEALDFAIRQKRANPDNDVAIHCLQDENHYSLVVTEV